MQRVLTGSLICIGLALSACHTTVNSDPSSWANEQPGASVSDDFVVEAESARPESAKPEVATTEEEAAESSEVKVHDAGDTVVSKGDQAWNEEIERLLQSGAWKTEAEDTPATTSPGADVIVEPSTSQVETNSKVTTPVQAMVEPTSTVEELEEVKLAISYERGGDLRAARMALTAALDSKLTASQSSEVISKLQSLNSRLFMSTGELGDMKSYTVKSGDSLGRIASRNGTTWQLIRRLNGLSSNVIRVDQKLVLPKYPLSVIVRKDEFTMDLLIDGAFLKRYNVTLGKNNSTPEGEFTVMNRIEKPRDGAFEYGHAEHRLGSHWLGLKGESGYNGYGIHGTRLGDEDKIGTMDSKGCVRLLNEQIAEVFDLLPVGTRVIIKAS